MSPTMGTDAKRVELETFKAVRRAASSSAAYASMASPTSVVM